MSPRGLPATDKHDLLIRYDGGWEDGHDELQLACIGHCVFQEFDQGRTERNHISSERKVRRIHAPLEGCRVDAGTCRRSESEP